ncbi:MAG: cysteine--tRNA ligase [Sphingomonadales bacterium]|nr:cysteine--tRNA ligase [Sphingomonadales bacterium]
MIRLYDTMERRKKEFTPADPKRITMYVCGPTVYGRAHIGNARPAVVFDTLARLIRHHYGADSLVYARNVTDVDDKIIAAAEAEGVGYRVITERYYHNYMEDMGALNVLPPDFEPRATAFVTRMVDMIQRLIDTGNAYVVEGHVLFSVTSDPGYGALSRRDREQMVAGARVEVAPYKRDAADFVLWKPAGQSAQHVALSWESPWGKGRPGWHIECSAMIEAFADSRGQGETIDIHGGGLDLIFPHHENEIAQSRCAHGGVPLARHWVHNGFVDMGAEKMSKSLDNVVGVDALLAAGHKGETLRLALLSGHYRSPLPWTEGLVAQAKATLDGLYRTVGDAKAGEPDNGVLDALADDLNTPLALSRLGGDRIRAELADEGILLEDGPEGTSWRRA